MGDKRVKDYKKKKKSQKRVLPAPSEPDSGEQCLGWRMEQIDFAGEWGWSGLNRADADRLRQELIPFEREPLRKLKDKRWVKFIPAAEMVSGAQDRLRKTESDEEG